MPESLGTWAAMTSLRRPTGSARLGSEADDGALSFTTSRRHGEVTVRILGTIPRGQGNAPRTVLAKPKPGWKAPATAPSRSRSEPRTLTTISLSALWHPA